MRVVVVNTSYNEARHIRPFVEHYTQQGCELIIRDHGSTDGTADKAMWANADITLEYQPRDPRGWSLVEANQWRTDTFYRVAGQNKGQDPLWFISVDTDELLMSPWPGITLHKAAVIMHHQGLDCARFVNATFVPTLEHPDHDHDDFQHTMVHYYPSLILGRGNQFFRFIPGITMQDAGRGIGYPYELKANGGHPLKMHPQAFPLLHYFWLGGNHAFRKWSERACYGDPPGWHCWGNRGPQERPHMLRLLPENDPRFRRWDPPRKSPPDISNPFPHHIVRTDLK